MVRYWFGGKLEDAPSLGTTDGRATFVVPGRTRASHAWVNADGCVPQDRHVDARPDLVERFALEPARVISAPPPLSAPIRANYCGHVDPWGARLFDIDLANRTREQRAAIFAQKRRMGLTHVVLAAEGGYQGAAGRVDPFDWTTRPDLVRALVAETLEAGFRPLFAASSGDAGTGPRALGYLPALLGGLGPLAGELHHFVAWECVKGGWTAKQLQDAYRLLFENVPGASVWFHGSDDASAGCSWSPVQEDDPARVWIWGRTDAGAFVKEGEARDDENRTAHLAGSDGTPGFWESDEPGWWSRDRGWNGAPLFSWRLAGQLFQTVSGRPLLEAAAYPPAYNGRRGYLGRVQECLDRIGVGGRGWLRKRFCVFESVAEDYFAGRCGDDAATRIARECADIGAVEFGNGVPEGA